ncbi:MAG TPA: cysteine synthase B, partial [Actinomycetota bacterium]
MKARDILDAIGNTPLVGIQRLSPKPDVRLWAKLEG